MGWELRSYQLAEMIMRYTDNKVPYDVVIKKARDYCQANPRRLSDLWSHVGDDYVAKSIAGGITGKEYF